MTTATSFNRAFVQRLGGALEIALAVAQGAVEVSAPISRSIADRLLAATDWRQAWMIMRSHGRGCRFCTSNKRCLALSLETETWSAACAL